MLLGMRRRFEPFVLDGSKTHTIRNKRKAPRRRPEPGDLCNVYGDSRQKTMHLLGRWPCTRVEDIRIEAHFGPWRIPLSVDIWIDGEQLSMSEVNRLCWVDGFRASDEENAWFDFAEYWGKSSRIPKTAGCLGFTGDLIHWDYAHPVQWAKKPRKRAAAAAQRRCA